MLNKKRTVLAACSYLDPDDIREYINGGGYEAARIAWTRLSPEAVCEEVTLLRSPWPWRRWFSPTGKKWEFTRVEKVGREICYL